MLSKMNRKIKIQTLFNVNVEMCVDLPSHFLQVGPRRRKFPNIINIQMSELDEVNQNK